MQKLRPGYDDAQNAYEGAKSGAQDCLVFAVKTVDAEFGEGYAKGHPEMVSGVMAALASEFNGAVLADALGAIADEITEMTEKLDAAASGIADRIMALEG
jgi:hypothetical protein